MTAARTIQSSYGGSEAAEKRHPQLANGKQVDTSLAADGRSRQPHLRDTNVNAAEDIMLKEPTVQHDKACAKSLTEMVTLKLNVSRRQSQL